MFCYQCVELGRRQGFIGFVWKKFKRLIIPCFVFGIVYYLLFRFNAARFTWRVAFWRVANGIGHLWFLPMLFWFNAARFTGGVGFWRVANGIGICGFCRCCFGASWRVGWWTGCYSGCTRGMRRGTALWDGCCWWH